MGKLTLKFIMCILLVNVFIVDSVVVGAKFRRIIEKGEILFRSTNFIFRKIKICGLSFLFLRNNIDQKDRNSIKENEFDKGSKKKIRNRIKFTCDDLLFL